MSDLLDWAVAQQMRSPHQKLVLILLAYRASGDGVVTVDTSTLARTAAISPRAAGLAVRGLKDAGLLTVQEPGTRTVPTVYRLRMPAKKPAWFESHP